MNIEQLFAHLKKLGTALSTKQLVGLASVFVAVVAVVVGSAYWISQPSYTLLVADMDTETANSVVTKLKEQKVPYQLGDGGRSVSVPVERADELRLTVASDGLPSAGHLGFEIFDRPAFGTTEFLEHVNYRRALEGELARTISTLAEVASARVHIAMAKDSLFVDQDQPAKASVVLRLKSNAPLPAATVKGIANLVAGSVEALRPDSVVILDTYGRPLTRPDGNDSGAGSTAEFDRQQQMEHDLGTRVVAMLEPVVGLGRVRVNVSAYLNPQTIEETEERWDPASVVRSKETSSETGAAAMGTGGVAGARANQPAALSTSAANAPAATAAGGAADATGAATPPAATPPAAPAPPATTAIAATYTPPSKTSEVTNYEVGRTTRHVLSPTGQLARLSVAVILDDERVTTKAADGGAPLTTTRPWDAQGIQRIHSLVAAAVGFNADRGDQLTVENIAFDTPQVEAEPAAPTFVQRTTEAAKIYGPSVARGAAVFALGLFALLGVLRPLARRASGLASVPALPAATGTGARLPTVQEMEGQIEAEMGANGGPRRLPVLTKRVAKLASEEPEQLARVVRGWITEDER